MYASNPTSDSPSLFNPMLPKEIKEIIFNFLSLREVICNIGRVCKEWRESVNTVVTQNPEAFKSLEAKHLEKVLQRAGRAQDSVLRRNYIVSLLRPKSLILASDP